jgi:hypothetical protein
MHAPNSGQAIVVRHLQLERRETMKVKTNLKAGIWGTWIYLAWRGGW